jgi:hypothetical protein
MNITSTTNEVKTRDECLLISDKIITNSVCFMSFTFVQKKNRGGEQIWNTHGNVTRILPV